MGLSGAEITRLERYCEGQRGEILRRWAIEYLAWLVEPQGRPPEAPWELSPVSRNRVEVQLLRALERRGYV